MELMVFGTGIFMLTMMAATLVFSRLLAKKVAPLGKNNKK